MVAGVVLHQLLLEGGVGVVLHQLLLEEGVWWQVWCSTRYGWK